MRISEHLLCVRKEWIWQKCEFRFTNERGFPFINLLKLCGNNRGLHFSGVALIELHLFNFAEK